MRQVAEGLEAAEVALDGLQQRQDVLDVLVHATRAAIGTSNADKRAALRNAVVNAVLGLEPDADERHLFVQLVDRFSPTHLRILKAFQNPLRWAAEHNVSYRPSMTSSLSGFLEAGFPELRGHRDFYDPVWSDLRQASLVTTDQLHSTMSDGGWQATRTSELGHRFLAFIEGPPQRR